MKQVWFLSPDEIPMAHMWNSLFFHPYFSLRKRWPSTTKLKNLGSDMIDWGAWKEEKEVTGFSTSWAGRYERTDVSDLNPYAPATWDHKYNLAFNELSAKNPQQLRSNAETRKKKINQHSHKNSVSFRADVPISQLFKNKTAVSRSSCFIFSAFKWMFDIKGN